MEFPASRRCEQSNIVFIPLPNPLEMYIVVVRVSCILIVYYAFYIRECFQMGLDEPVTLLVCVALQQGAAEILNCV